MPETIPIGADHAGYELKQRLIEELGRLGYQPLDLGTHSAESTDYPPIAHAVARRVQGGEASRGILMCGTGLGMLPARCIPEDAALAILHAWLDSGFAGGRHARRVAGIDAEGS